MHPGHTLTPDGYAFPAALTKGSLRLDTTCGSPQVLPSLSYGGSDGLPSMLLSLGTPARAARLPPIAMLPRGPVETTRVHVTPAAPAAPQEPPYSRPVRKGFQAPRLPSLCHADPLPPAAAGSLVKEEEVTHQEKPVAMAPRLSRSVVIPAQPPPNDAVWVRIRSLPATHEREFIYLLYEEHCRSKLIDIARDIQRYIPPSRSLRASLLSQKVRQALDHVCRDKARRLGGEGCFVLLNARWGRKVNEVVRVLHAVNAFPIPLRFKLSDQPAVKVETNAPQM